MKPVKNLAIFLIIFIMLFTTACGEDEEQEEENSESEEEELPEEIEEIEADLLMIMEQVDLIPVVQAEPVQVEDNGEGDEDEDEGDEEEENGEEGNGEEDEDENGDDEEAEEDITFEETLLNEVLEAEEQEDDNEDEEQGNGEGDELPQEEEEIWTEVNNIVAELFHTWDDLKPELMDENVPTEQINSFEETLDNLIIASTEEEYFDSLKNANDITQLLAQFREPFTEDKTPEAFEIKYHTRNTIIEGSINNYQQARESMDYMQEVKEDLGEELEEKEAEEISQQTQDSMDRLEASIKKENLDLVKLNGAVVIENINEAIEEMEDGS